MPRPLSEEEYIQVTKLKKFFFLYDPGYSMVEATIQSPWVEYLLQRFANTFIRVGVDLSADDKDIEKMLTILLGGND